MAKKPEELETTNAAPVAPNPIFRAIVATTQAVSKIGKSEFNKHQAYKYVPIDDYYEHVASVAADNGLSWVLVEDSFELLPTVGKQGSVKVSYRALMFHQDSPDFMEFSKLTIIHPHQGAQTLGSAISYADKCWMRQIFKVATGEPDADATNQNETDWSKASSSAPADDFLSMAPAPTVLRERTTSIVPITANELLRMDIALPPKPKQTSASDVQAGVDFIENILKTFIPDCKTEAELSKFWTDNKVATDKIKDNSPEAYQGLISVFKDKKLELKAAQNV